MGTPLTPQQRQALKAFLKEHQTWKYRATLEAAKQRRANDLNVNARNEAVAKQEVAFVEAVQARLDGRDIPEKHEERIQAILS
jgi:hypothetical protein